MIAYPCGFFGVLYSRHARPFPATGSLSAKKVFADANQANFFGNYREHKTPSAAWNSLGD